MPKTIFQGVSYATGIETYGFAREIVDINIYIGFLEVFTCHEN
jgi:hypothetical protein